MSMFSKGYSAVDEEKARQEKIRENAGKRLPNFFLQKDKDEAEVRFLTEEPITFNAHTIPMNRKGKQIFTTFVCTGEDCPHCEAGDRPSFKGAFLIYDRREFEFTDNAGKKKKASGQLRLYVVGVTILGQIQRIHDKYGLVNTDLTIIRIGSGTSTTYTFDRGESFKLSVEEIRAMIPEKMREQYNGTAASLNAMLENQLTMMIDDSAAESKDSDSDDNGDDLESELRHRRNLVGSDDEDEVEPKKSSTKPKLFGKKQPVENSVKGDGSNTTAKKLFVKRQG